MPVYNTLGNHEVFGLYEKSGISPEHPEYGKQMYKNKLGDGKTYFSFDHIGWHFIILDGIGFTHAWGGAMGVARSMRPSVNFDPESRLGWAGGYFGNGVGASNLAGRTLADLVNGRETERTRLPWVNPDQRNGKWEIEPVRWLGFRLMRLMMLVADRREYLAGR